MNTTVSPVAQTGTQVCVTPPAFTNLTDPAPAPGQLWADVVGGQRPSISDAGYMSQTSSVMDDMNVTRGWTQGNPAWEWTEHFEDGMVFVCTTQTFDESVKRMLLGLPKQYMVQLKKLTPRSHIFLFNKSTKTMHAGYHPGGEADWNICPQAFTPIRYDSEGNPKRQPPGSKYPAQIPFSVFRHLAPLPEEAFQGVLKDPRKPKLLKRAHVRQLLRIFLKNTPGAGSESAAQSPVKVQTFPVLSTVKTHLVPPVANFMPGSPTASSSPASVASYSSGTPPPAMLSPVHSQTPSPITVMNVQPVATNVRVVPMPVQETRGDDQQSFKLRSTDSLKRLQNGNIRPMNHLMTSMHDRITTLQAQVQQQQLIINNLTYQLAQSQLQRLTVVQHNPNLMPVYSPDGASPPVSPPPQGRIAGPPIYPTCPPPRFAPPAQFQNHLGRLESRAVSEGWQ